MSNYSTRKQRNGFGVGIFMTTLFHAGWDLCNLGGWALWLGIPMIIFTVIFSWAYTMEKPKNQEDEV